MSWDHAFFKSILFSQIDELVEPEGDFSSSAFGDDLINQGEELVAKGLDSVIDQRYVSFLSRDQELSIPTKPVQLQQNKKLISIWLEAKEQLNAELTS